MGEANESKKVVQELLTQEQQQKRLSSIENEIFNILVKNKLSYSECQYLIYYLQREIKYKCKL